MTAPTTSLPSPGRCRFYRDGDAPAILRVLQASFTSWPRVDISCSPLDHLRWKLASHPIASTFTPVAEHDGEIAGVRLVMVREVIFYGAPLLAYQAADISVAPSCRERGLLNRLVDIDYRGLDGRVAVQTFDLKLAYESGHPAVLRLQETIPGIFPLGNQLEALSRPNPGSPAPAPRISTLAIRNVDAFDDRVDVLWRNASTAFDLICSRTKDVVNWRYADRRAGRFDITIAEHDGVLLGYVVTRCSRGRGYIADLLVLPGRLDVASILVDHALVSLQPHPLERIECWLPARHPYQELLRCAGFTARDSRLRLNCRPCIKTAQELELLRDPNVRVHFTAGDTDLV